MLTKQCKDVLKNLVALSNHSTCEVAFLGCTSYICLFDDYNQVYDYSKYQKEIISIIEHLALEGYIIFTNAHERFFLTQKALQKKQFSSFAVRLFLADKSIDILALIISIIALAKSYGVDLLAWIPILCKLLSTQ